MKFQASPLILGLSIASTTLAAPVPDWQARASDAMVQPDDGDMSFDSGADQSFDQQSMGDTSYEDDNRGYNGNQYDNDNSATATSANTDTGASGGDEPVNHGLHLGLGLGMRLGIGGEKQPAVRDVREEWVPRARGMPGKWARGFREKRQIPDVGQLLGSVNPLAAVTGAVADPLNAPGALAHTVTGATAGTPLAAAAGVVSTVQGVANTPVGLAKGVASTPLGTVQNAAASVADAAAPVIDSVEDTASGAASALPSPAQPLAGAALGTVANTASTVANAAQHVARGLPVDPDALAGAPATPLGAIHGVIGTVTGTAGGAAPLDALTGVPATPIGTASNVVGTVTPAAQGVASNLPAPAQDEANTIIGPAGSVASNSPFGTMQAAAAKRPLDTVKGVASTVAGSAFNATDTLPIAPISAPVVGTAKGVLGSTPLKARQLPIVSGGPAQVPAIASAVSGMLGTPLSAASAVTGAATGAAGVVGASGLLDPLAPILKPVVGGVNGLLGAVGDIGDGLGLPLGKIIGPVTNLTNGLVGSENSTVADAGGNSTAAAQQADAGVVEAQGLLGNLLKPVNDLTGGALSPVTGIVDGLGPTLGGVVNGLAGAVSGLPIIGGLVGGLLGSLSGLLGSLAAMPAGPNIMDTNSTLPATVASAAAGASPASVVASLGNGSFVTSANTIVSVPASVMSALTSGQAANLVSGAGVAAFLPLQAGQVLPVDHVGNVVGTGMTLAQLVQARAAQVASTAGAANGTLISAFVGSTLPDEAIDTSSFIGSDDGRESPLPSPAGATAASIGQALPAPVQGVAGSVQAAKQKMVDAPSAPVAPGVGTATASLGSL